MSKEENTVSAASPSGGGLSEAESSLGQALAVIHRILPRLDEPGRADDVQAALRRAAACIESARASHQKIIAVAHQVAAAGASKARVEAETVAVIAAAVAAVLDRPYRLVSVQPVPVPVPHLNVWALEGRTQIFQSHKIR